MQEVAIYIILLFPLIWEVASDSYRILVRKKTDNHKTDLYTRTLMCVSVGLILHWEGGYPFLPGFIYSGTIFIALFDLIMGVILHGNPFYRGSTSVTDRWLLSHADPLTEVFIRAWILSVGIGCFYHWESVVGK